MKNWSPIPMEIDGNTLTITQKKPYIPVEIISKDALNKSFNFAYEMAYSNKHREHRTNGSKKRCATEIFVNAFIGKLSEFVLFEYLVSSGIDVEKPDTKIYDRGVWDTEDLIVHVRDSILKVTVKSTKSFGNLLLLEYGDWDKQANYLPSNEKYDVFILVRINLDLENFLKRKYLLYSDFISRENMIMYIKEVLDAGDDFDFAGFLTQKDIIKIIENEQIIWQGQTLNGTTQMDASNYYVQSGNMKSLDKFVEMVKQF